MERTLYSELKMWKTSPTRKALIVRGARQVGKSFLIELFGQQEFSSIHIVNFEKKPQLKSCFESLEPKKILKELEWLDGRAVIPGKSLLFLDEIQDCPQALKALRYFTEEMPELHVIAAGSLLEFILEERNFSFPVGRVQMINLAPLTFSEYLMASDNAPIGELLRTLKPGDTLSEEVHQHLLNRIQEFFRIGGMPGVVSAFRKTGSYLEAERYQAAILDLYQLDFGKYATKHAEYRHLKKLFEKAPNLVGKHFKFSKIDPDSANAARDYRQALTRLTQARLIHPVYFTKGNGLPLRAEKNEKKFKIFFLDVGLLAASLGSGHTQKTDAPVFRGVMAEQYAAQELSALQDPFIDRGLYYWENTKPSSSAEVDFLVNLEGQILPIEVKAGATGRLKSLKQFMELKGVSLGVRISEAPLSFEGGILSVPFYLIGELRRLKKMCS